VSAAGVAYEPRKADLMPTLSGSISSAAQATQMDARRGSRAARRDAEAVRSAHRARHESSGGVLSSGREHRAERAAGVAERLQRLQLLQRQAAALIAPT
jgi:hypothetical protein